MSEPIRTIPLSGFDPAGEPEVQVMADGALCLVCNFMPPSDVRDDEEEFFSQFDQELERALGVPVTWEDRERFLIAAPAEDTLPRLTRFVQGCRRGRARAAGSSRGRPAVRAALYDALGRLVEPAGFQLRKREEGFVRAVPGGRQTLVVTLWGHPPAELSFGLVCCVAMDAVTSLLKPFGGGTILTQLEHFGLEPVRPYGVQLPIPSLEAVGQTVGKAASVIRGQLLPYFDRYQTVAALDEALHGGGSEEEQRPQGWQGIVARLRPRPEAAATDEWLARRQAFDSSGPPYREMTALAIARLAGNPRFEELVTRYRGQLVGLQPVDAQKFEQLVALLREEGGG